MIGVPRARILVVYDELPSHRVVQSALRRDGYEIIACDDVDQAMRLVTQADIDVVVLDLQRPICDGIDTCSRIRKDLGLALVPVLVVGHESEHARVRAKQAGADDFLPRTFEETELLDRVRRLLVLLRVYHRLNEAHCRRAEAEARRWRLASEIATAVAGCLDYQSLIAIVYDRLRAALGIDFAALYAGDDDDLQRLATAGRMPNTVPRLALPNVRATCPSPHACVVSVSLGRFPVGAFCVGRNIDLDPEERRILEEVVVHVANAVAHVSSHLAIVDRLMHARHEQEETEAALRASEMRHRILFDASPLPMWVSDPKSLRILAVNEALSTVLGYSRRELLAMSVPNLELQEGRYVRKDGQTVELDVSSHATMLGDELVMLAVGVDVTQARRMEEQLRQSQKMEAIGQLAGGIAHDFNNILAAILSNAEVAREELGESHRNTADIREIEAAANRAVVLTRQLLTFSRRDRREVKVLAVAEVVRGVQRMLARLVPENIEMVATLDAATGAVEADSGQLQQLLMNFVVNSRDAMPDGGRLTIETTNIEVDGLGAECLGVVPGRYVRLSVTDTGCGMDEATRARVFEPFFTTKAVGAGTGLGLSTVFGIVKQSQGAITVESEPGQGATFRVYLPRVERAPAVIAAAAPKRPATTGSGLVLVVEDDIALRSVIKRQLSSRGFSLLEAPNGLAALEMLDGLTQPIDLLLTDLVMPGIDGRALARRVVEGYPQTKVLFMSGYTEHAAVKTAALSPDDYFIAKPFTGASLSSAIQRVLGAPR